MQPLERLDRYLIERKLSEGGMAEVFLAKTATVAGFEKKVVIKSLLSRFGGDSSFSKMLLNEAFIAASLDHPNIIQVVDLVQSEEQHFLVMEYLDGQNLRQILRRETELERRLPPGLACRITADVLSGLSYAHARTGGDGRPLGLVHRDVSLANVVVTYTGAVKLIDFGVAKATEGADMQLTRAGQFKGKCAYMSPEQVLCKPLDRRSDLFSLGIIFWEMLTRQRLFLRKAEADSLIAICDQDAPPPSAAVTGLPKRLDEICQRALARDRERRYQTADEMRKDIETLVLEQGWAASPFALQQEMISLFRSETASALAMPPPAQTVVLYDEELEPVLEMVAGTGSGVADATSPEEAPASGEAPAVAPAEPAGEASATDGGAAPVQATAPAEAAASVDAPAPAEAPAPVEAPAEAAAAAETAGSAAPESAPRSEPAEAAPLPPAPMRPVLAPEEEWATPNPDVLRRPNPKAAAARPNESAEIKLLMQHNTGNTVYDTWPTDSDGHTVTQRIGWRGIVLAAILCVVAGAALTAVVHFFSPTETAAPAGK
jgi:serine/threonine-protein kinase